MAISRRGMRRIVVDGAEYFWRAARDWYDDSDVLIVCEQPRRRILFARARHDPQELGWWHPLPAIVLPRHIERAIKIAPRGVESRLSNREVLEVFGYDPGRPQDRLRDLERALAERGPIVQALLAFGCHADTGELVDDWIACYADMLTGAARDALQALIDGVPAGNRHMACEVRSAAAFLVDACAKVGVGLAVDTVALDEMLGREPGVGRPPKGIPAHHDWWWR